MAGISKAANDRQKRVLSELLALPGNNVCADCMSSAPRWASWNLGIFICVQCAAAHRKLGTHISKVKSVTLDTWTKEQVESMKELGPNTKANAIYNPDIRRNPAPTNTFDSERDSELETFIRNKYQYKAFIERPQPAVPSLEVTSKFRLSDIITARRKTPSPLSSGRLSSGGLSYRETINAVSPTASNLMAEMESHSRSLERGKSTRPSSAGVNSSAAARDTQFSSVGVTPPSSNARPSTASSLNTKRSILSSSPVPVITTTSPTKPSAGGFSWTSNPTAPPEPPSKPRFTIPDKSPPPPPVHAAAAPAQASPPRPPPQPQRSLYEEDLLSLLGNAPALQPPASQATPATNPFPSVASPYNAQIASSFGPRGMITPATGLNGSMSAMSLGGGTQNYMTGASATPMMMGGPSPANPFHTYGAGMNGGSATSNITPSPFQSAMAQPFTSSQPQFTPSQQQYPVQPQFTSASSFTGASPFQQHPQQPPPPQQQQQPQPFQLSTAPSPFHAGSSTPFASSPFNNTNNTPFPSGTPNNNSPFASFAQGMLPQMQQQPQQQQSHNPFMQQQYQQQQQQQAGMGMGMNSWG
ncbi:hypothetical protein FRB97_003947 [Tulasnella sp. 331]|nr:hypothetical protein FRB97_003947 [Tulasnella sp. 331]